MIDFSEKWLVLVFVEDVFHVAVYFSSLVLYLNPQLTHFAWYLLMHIFYSRINILLEMFSYKVCGGTDWLHHTTMLVLNLIHNGQILYEEKLCFLENKTWQFDRKSNGRVTFKLQHGSNVICHRQHLDRTGWPKVLMCYHITQLMKLHMLY